MYCLPSPVEVSVGFPLVVGGYFVKRLFFTKRHSDSEVERRDVPYNTAPKAMKKIAENYENYENCDRNLGLS